MRLLGEGVLAGLHARGVRKLERDPILRNARIRDEQRRAHMRALMTVPPAKFPGGELGRMVFAVALVRVAPANQQITGDELPDALGPVRAGVAMHLDPSEGRIRWEHSQAVGPWAVRFTVHEDAPTAQLEDFEPDDALLTAGIEQGLTERSR